MATFNHPAGALAADTNAVNVAIGSTVAAGKNTCGGCASVLNLYRNGSTAAGFTNASTIGIQSGLPPQAS